MSKILTYGMVGGGPDAFIGLAHRRAIALDGVAELVSGCFSRNFEKSLEQADQLNLDKSRVYKSFEEMAEIESQREDKIDFVVIVTTNISHYAACKCFLNVGIPVVCEKPLVTELEHAIELKKIAKEKDLLFMVTYIYSGHVTAMQAKALIKSGEIGDIRTVMGEYPQGYLAYDTADSGEIKKSWRIDPSQAGKTNALGDIGTHIENTVYRMTGLKIKKVLARMDKVVPSRELDDNSHVMVEFENGATGVYWASQIAIGHNNSLKVRIYGSKGSILWDQEQPEKLTLVKDNNTRLEICRGDGDILPCAAKYQRLPGGHTEGWFEAMANLYRSFVFCLNAKNDNTFTEEMIEFPTIDDGVDGVAFVDACLKSNEQGNVWINMAI